MFGIRRPDGEHRSQGGAECFVDWAPITALHVDEVLTALSAAGVAFVFFGRSFT